MYVYLLNLHVFLYVYIQIYTYTCIHTQERDPKGYALTGGLSCGSIVVWKASTGKKVTSIQVLKKGAISVTASMITAHHMVLVGDGEGTVSGYTSETFGEKSVVPKFSFKTSDALQVCEGGGGGAHDHSAGVRSMGLRKWKEDGWLVIGKISEKSFSRVLSMVNLIAS